MSSASCCEPKGTLMASTERFIKCSARRLPLVARMHIEDVRATIYNKYKAPAYFVHINKTGGSSVEVALGLPFQHKTVRMFQQEVGERRWRERLTFSIVRNPWDRIASLYHYRLKYPPSSDSDVLRFPDWIRAVFEEEDPAYVGRELMVAPQWEWLRDKSGKLGVDSVCRFECLEADFSALCSKLGVTVNLPHVKRSTNRDYTSLYGVETRRIVASVFERDIEEFHYRFGSAQT